MPPIPKHICQINWPQALACKQMQLAHFQDAVEVSVSQRSPTPHRAQDIDLASNEMPQTLASG